MNTSLPPGQTVAINGMQMYYVTHGQGEPLLLLHGFLGSSSDWALFTPELAREYQLIILDQRGHGRSTNPSREFTFRQAALDVFALLDHLRIERFQAIGVSGGGNILLHLATQQPSRVASMVLVSATSYFPEQAREVMRQFTIEKRYRKPSKPRAIITNMKDNVKFSLFSARGARAKSRQNIH